MYGRNHDEPNEANDASARKADEMLIRPAVEQDAGAMGELIVTTFLAAHRGQMPDQAWARRAKEWTPQISATSWARTIRAIGNDAEMGECLYVADEQGAIIGLAMGGPAHTEGVSRTGAVYSIYVAREYHGRGIGRKLVQAVAADLARKGLTALQIGCLAANAAARGFYEALGGTVVDERMFDEEGILIPEVVYEWPNIKILIDDIP